MRNFFVKSFLVILFLFLFFSVSLLFYQSKDELQPIKKILELPEDKIDIATAMLTIDKIIDPSVDINKYLKEIDALLVEIKKQSVDPRGDFIVIKKILYEEGPWNNYKPYKYNLEDPFGKDITNHLLSHYLDTKIGNCVSMPMLYYIICRKLGFEAYISTAPSHMFVQTIGGTQFYGIETTRKGRTWKLEDFIMQWDISEKEKANNLYYQRFTKKEIISELLNQAVVYYMNTKQYKKGVKTADLALKYMPNNYMVMLNKAAIYGNLIDDKIYISGIISSNIKNKDGYYKLLELEQKKLRNTVDNLGYRPLSKKNKEEILEMVRRLKAGLENV